MTQDKINKAYSSLLKLKRYDLPVKKAYAVYKLFSALENAYGFALAEEQKYMAELGGSMNNDGTATFPTQEACLTFTEKVKELCGMEVDIAVEVFSLSEDDLNGQRIAPEDISNLDGFVNFE